MVTVPSAEPVEVTTPPVLTPATAGSLLAQVPPVALLSVVLPPRQMPSEPLIGPAPGVTVTTLVTWQPDDKEYVTVKLPVAIPHTLPEPDMLATVDGVPLHAPPETASLCNTQAPIHTLDAPVMADGNVATVTTAVTKQPEPPE